MQTWFAPRLIIPLTCDSGGVTTSTVTVPLVAALGLGLASNVPGRSPVLDGFGPSLDIRMELVLFLVHESIVDAILLAIREAERFSDPGTGIAMVMPVDQIAGMESQESRNQR